MSDRWISWRPRFSLRTLLLLMALVSVVAAWLTQSALKQRRAVAELSKLGVDVTYEHQANPQSMWRYPEWFRNWLGIDFFAEATAAEYGGFHYYGSSQLGRTIGNSTSTVVLSDATRRRAATRGRIVATTVMNPADEFNDEIARQLGNLPFLKMLTIRALTANQANSQLNSRRNYSIGVPLASLFDPQALQLLRNHPTLRELDLSLTTADDEVLAGLNGFVGLQRLSLGGMAFTEQGAQQLATLTNLQELKFESSGLQSDASLLNYLPTIPALRQLSIRGVTITNQNVSCLARFPNLEKLECISITVDNDGLRHLSELSQLRDLNLVDSRITDLGAAHLGKLVNLRRLVLTNNRITDDGMRHFAKLSKLETLYLPQMPITDTGLAYLRDATEMQVLLLSGTKITDDGIKHLAKMSQLRSLDLSFTAITDTSIEPLLQFKKMGHLRLLGTSVTRPAARLYHAAIPATTLVMPDAADLD